MADEPAHNDHALDYVDLGVTEFSAAKAFCGQTKMLPDPAQARICGEAFAEVMVRLGA